MLKRILCLLLCAMLICCGAMAEELLNAWDRIARVDGAEDLFCICKNNLWGLAHRDGTVILEPQFNSAPEFANGYAVVSVGNPYLAQATSDAAEYSLSYGVINAAGEIILPAEYDQIEISAEADYMLVRKNEKYSYMNMQGELMIDAEYDRARMFSGDYAAVANFYDLGDDNRDSMGYTTCWGMIDRSGKALIPLDYDFLDVGENGIAAVQLNQKYGFINAENKTIVDFKYYSAEHFTGGYAPVAIAEYPNGTSGDSSKDMVSSWGIIDESGREVVPCRYASLLICENGLALVQKHDTNRYSYIDMQGNAAFSGEFDRAEAFIGDLAAVGQKTDRGDGRYEIRWGVIDSQGKMLLEMNCSWVSIRPDGTIEAMIDDEIVLYGAAELRVKD